MEVFRSGLSVAALVLGFVMVAYSFRILLLAWWHTRYRRYTRHTRHGVICRDCKRDKKKCLGCDSRVNSAFRGIIKCGLLFYSGIQLLFFCWGGDPGIQYIVPFGDTDVFERGVLVLGQTGGGKSSLINSFIKEYDFKENPQNLQPSGNDLHAVTMHTTEVNVTVRIWNAPDRFKPETGRPMAMAIRFYDTRGFLDHHDDAGTIADDIKQQFTHSGPVMHTLMMVIKVDRMGPLAAQLHTLLRSLPQGAGVMLVLTHCNDLSNQAVGNAEGTFKNEVVKALKLNTFVTCLRPWKHNTYPREALEKLVLKMRFHQMRWSFPDKKPMPKISKAELQAMKIKKMKDLADQHGIDVSKCNEPEEYVDRLHPHFALEDEL